MFAILSFTVLHVVCLIKDAAVGNEKYFIKRMRNMLIDYMEKGKKRMVQNR